MYTHRLSLWGLFLVLGGVVLVACEPYMSMTDQIPAQTGRAATLLPESPRYVGMVDVETVFRRVEDLRGQNLADSIRQTDHALLGQFLTTTGLDPESDVEAVYGTLEGEEAFSAVLFASLTSEQVDRYLRNTDGAGRAVTYRDTPLYHLALQRGEGGAPESVDTLSLSILENGTIAASMDADRVRAMVDRHRAGAGEGLQANDTYMTLVKRVGRGSTAWLVGGDVVQTALQDKAAEAQEAETDETPRVNQAGLQQALSKWADRVLGLSEVSGLGKRTSGKVDQLERKLRDQAVSLTLTETALEGEVYLTMGDDASASSVVDVAEGAVAMLKLSKDDLDERHRDLLDEVTVERDGSIVHVEFTLDRKRLQKKMRAERRPETVRPTVSSVRPSISAIRRMAGITLGALPLREILKAVQPIR